MLPAIMRALVVALVIPLGLDLYMPVPEDNPITAENIDLGRRVVQRPAAVARPIHRVCVLARPGACRSAGVNQRCPVADVTFDIPCAKSQLTW